MKNAICVGIAGGTASGKTTLALALRDRFSSEDVALISIDNYYRKQDLLTDAQRASVNYDHPDSIEFDYLAEHIGTLCAGRSIQMPIYDFTRHNRLPSLQHVDPRRIIIVEGILCLANLDLRELFDLSLFVDAPDSLRFERRVARDTKERGRSLESVYKQWNETVQPMFEQYCKPSRAFADLLVSGADDICLHIDEILSQILAIDIKANEDSKK